MTKQEFKEKCIELRLKNHTLGEMVKLLKRSKTTIYFHIKDIPGTLILREKKARVYRHVLDVLRRKGIAPQKGKSMFGRKFKNFARWTPDLVNLMAHTLFDGQISKTSIYYHNRSGVLIENFRGKMKLIYEYEPTSRVKGGGVITIGYHNAALTNFIRSRSESLIRDISNLDKECQRQFLKAFFDDEGCVRLKNNKRFVKGYQHDNKILYLVQKLLLKLSIESKVDSRFHEIIISRKENLEKFAKEINFMPSLSVNGKRSNSVWKRDIEKREILARALNSYLPSNLLTKS